VVLPPCIERAMVGCMCGPNLLGPYDITKFHFENYKEAWHHMHRHAAHCIWRFHSLDIGKAKLGKPCVRLFFSIGKVELFNVKLVRSKTTWVFYGQRYQVRDCSILALSSFWNITQSPIPNPLSIIVKALNCILDTLSINLTGRSWTNPTS
jgi:hypothetical protein